MKAVFLTAGAAGMYCGSCMHDNAIAKALRADGVDCLLQPVYTPIRTDEASIASNRLFFGGVHIYLLQQMPWLHHVPLPIRRVLDWKPLIQLATRRAASTDAEQLGALAVSMLQGAQGRQADEVARLADWLCEEIKPDAILFTNLLIGGCLPLLRERLPDSRLVVLLQGDDIFLDHLPAARRSEAIELCRKLVPSVDRFVVNSQFYGDKMGSLLSIPSEKLVTTPLSIDIRPYHHPTARGDAGDRNDGFRIGYMARIAPEKGLHHLVESFIQLAGQPRHQDLSLHAAGWLGEANRGYLSELQQRIADAGLSDRFVYHGSPSLEEKIRLIRSFDVMSVPTEYQDPKGLFVLEALALGVPVIQPEHGAFPELIASTGGGLLVRPGDVAHLGEAINQLKSDPALRVRLGQTGAQRVAERHTIEQASKAMKQICFEDT
jgi:glycosyltransferase involved in cell wall biosynthesis